MKNIAVFYSSKEGQTARIAGRIASSLSADGMVRVSMFNVDELAGRMETFPYDGAIVGGSVHLGEHSMKLKEFIYDHRHLLESVPTGFFSVSLSAAGDPGEKDDARRLVDDLIKQTGWMPDQIEIFAGAVRYQQYNPFLRWLMKRKIRSLGRNDTNTHRNYEYTNWQRVDRFANEYLTESVA